MITADQLVSILTNETKPCSIELEMFDAIGKTPMEIQEVTGRAFEVEQLILPDFEGGGAPILANIVRFQ